MHYARLALAATPILIASVSAYGNAIINNECNEDVYYWEDKGVPSPPMKTLQAGGSTGKMPLYQTGKADGAGPSFKLATKQNGAPPTTYIGIPLTQFEYTVNAPGFQDTTSFDISNVNSEVPSNPGPPPFKWGGVTIGSTQDSAANMTCPPPIAVNGVTPKCQAYKNPHDDKQGMTSTPMNNDIVMTLCYVNSENVQGGSSAGGVLSGASSVLQQVSSAVSSPQESQPAPQVNEKLAVQHSPAPQAPSSSPEPSPSPTPSPAPVKEQPSPVQEKHTVYKTVYADPVVETVHKMLNEHIAGQKRDGHIHAHAHAHAHQKINKRRHGA